MVLPAKWESRSPPFSARGEGFHLDSFPSLLFYTPLFLALLNHLIAEYKAIQLLGFSRNLVGIGKDIRNSEEEELVLLHL